MLLIILSPHLKFIKSLQKENPNKYLSPVFKSLNKSSPLYLSSISSYPSCMNHTNPTKQVYSLKHTQILYHFPSLQAFAPTTPIPPFPSNINVIPFRSSHHPKSRWSFLILHFPSTLYFLFYTTTHGFSLPRL